jgi:hypothetical protein
MAVTIDHYDQFVELMGDIATTYGGWPNDTLIIMLMNSSHVFTATNTLRTNVNANELATGAGYTQSDGAGAGEALTSVTSSQPAAGTWMLDAADASWTASGGSIGPATDAVVFDDTITVPLNPLMFDIDFGAAETAGEGTDFLVTWNANGICRII